nr:GtrA family protein [uncultured Blautia sp.]
MITLIKKLYASDVIRYIFFGGCTTLVNLVSFFIMRQAGVQRDLANVISIILAILFAYVVNSKFVFQDKCQTLKDHIQPFCKFIGARLVTMAIEVGGVWFFAEIINMNDMVGKFITQFVVLALNYIFSKFLVFTSGRKV